MATMSTTEHAAALTSARRSSATSSDATTSSPRHAQIASDLEKRDPAGDSHPAAPPVPAAPSGLRMLGLQIGDQRIDDARHRLRAAPSRPQTHAVDRRGGSSRELRHQVRRRIRPRREHAASERRRLVEPARHAADVRRRILEARRDVALLLHAPKRDVDRAALETALRRADELQSVQLAAVDEQLEDQRFLRRQCQDAGGGVPACASVLLTCKTAVKSSATIRLSRTQSLYRRAMDLL